MQTRFLSCAALALVLAAGVPSSVAQAKPAPSAPEPAAASGPQFPPTSPANFTAAQPTKAEVDAFLKTSWGYDANRVWQIYAIQRTDAPGVSKVTVFIGEKPKPQLAELTFFVTPDGHHLISQNSMLDFGPHPYAAKYSILRKEANGPSLGDKNSKMMLVEFADFECPHCKEAEPLVEKLVHDFPQARYVFQFFPLVSIHPMAFQAAAYGACVYRMGGDAAFFKYADAIFAAQNELEGKDADTALNNSVTPTGLDPGKVAACANSPEGKAPVEASMQLGTKLGVDETPTLFINGRAVPMMGVPYPELKKIIEWQFALDKAEAGTTK